MAFLRKIFFTLVLVTILFASCDGLGGFFEGGSDDADSDDAGSVDDSSVLPNIKPFQKGEAVSRTLLVYLMAENDISYYLKNDFDEIKNAAYYLPDDARLFVFFDNSDANCLPALYQFHSYNNRLVENVAYEFDKDVCSSDTTVLGQVMDIIFKDYPTEAFDLVMGSHADGWVTNQAKSSASRWIGIDNGENSLKNDITTTIEVKELAELLERMPVKVDRLMFDACLMQGVEVAYTLRNSVNWIIASPAEIPADGAPYDKVVPEFFKSSSGVEGIMYEYKKAYDNEYYAAVLSAVCTSCMQELANSTRVYVEKYFNTEANNSYTSCLAYAPRVAPAYYDVNSVMKKFLAADDYENWKYVFDRAVPYIMVSNSKMVWSNKTYKFYPEEAKIAVTPDAGVVSAYFPQNRSQNKVANEDFRSTEWYIAAGWDVAGW